MQVRLLSDVAASSGHSEECTWVAKSQQEDTVPKPNETKKIVNHECFLASRQNRRNERGGFFFFLHAPLFSLRFLADSFLDYYKNNNNKQNVRIWRLRSVQ